MDVIDWRARARWPVPWWTARVASFTLGVLLCAASLVVAERWGVSFPFGAAVLWLAWGGGALIWMSPDIAAAWSRWVGERVDG